MKYKIYLEQEYRDFAGDLEPDREIEYYLRLQEVKQYHVKTNTKV